MAQHSHSPEHEGALARETLAHTTKAHVTPHHEPGTMDITRQQETFVTFLRFTTRMAVVIVVLLLLLALFNG
ncbi:aa3-type cytochrome c oxidase subunit IV [Rubellimicrobium arenae]|uniref:aa3-type cytochrome c oxidase subunit IV n=1 Tax=Rubellimicrobium arenae TaxID=2817372 RepID=UPI001B30AE03|nr:aa3-type cytochrome c oxidase subunit IV [Rubellimicrobium arenae]